jgi:predicted Zn-dependent peptidase
MQLPVNYLCLICLFFASVFPLTVIAGKYTPEGIYDVRKHKLDNGLEVYLKERHEAKTAAIRLVVNYGADDNECGKTETAHYLEHLLFTGTSKHTEMELDDLIEDNGGSWNAYTAAETTTYEINIYSPYTELALNTLHEILTDSTISEENVQTTLDIINREAGGEYSWLTRYLYTFDIGKSGYDKASEVIYSEEEYCPIIESFSDISRDDIIAAYRKFYVPDNMALIMVGDFDSDTMLEVIENSFGKMKPGNSSNTRPSGEHQFNAPEIYTSTLVPLIGNNAEVYIRYRTPGRLSSESLKINMLSVYLSQQLYDVIRINQGLSYSTGAGVNKMNNYGTLDLYADSDIENLDIITSLMLEEVDKLISMPIETGKFERVKRGALLSYVSSFEDNSTIANFYVSTWQSLMTMEKFTRLENVIANISPEDIQALATKYLAREKAVINHDAPTLTYEQAYIITALLFFLFIYSIRRKIARYFGR